MEANLVLLALLALGLLLAGPVIGIAAFVRANRLAQRLSDLEHRLAARLTSTEPLDQIPAGPQPSVAPAPGTDVPKAPAAKPPAVTIGDRPVLDPLPRKTAPALDWETIVAGRWLNRVGLLAVAIGASYFLKYAIDNDWIGPHGQVALGTLLGASLVLWSDAFSRKGAHYFADGIAGLGAAILYLSLWAGTSYYGIVGTDAGFFAMIAVTAAMVVVAYRRDRAPLAALALLGGFLTPWLVSTGRDAEVALFSYIAVLNVALILTSRLRDWRFVEIPAFAFTQIYFWAWYGRFYSAEVLGRTGLFAALFFSQFSALPAIRARRFGTVRAEHGILLLLNSGLFLLALRAMLWKDHRWLLAFDALALSLAYVGLTRVIPTNASAASAARLLPAGLAVTMSVVAIGVRLDAQWMAVAWAVEAGVLAWTGFDAGLPFARKAGYLLFVVVALRLLGAPLHAIRFLFNARLATVLITAGSVALAVRGARRSRGRLFDQEATLIAILAVAANVLVIWALTLEIDLYFGIGISGPFVSGQTLFARSLAISLLWTIYASGLVAAGVRLGSAAVRWQGLALFGVATVKVFFADLSYLSGIYRIVSSIALGTVLLIVSFLYQRSIAARRLAQEHRP